MFYQPYSNIFLCSRKKSGKTTVVYNIIKECTDINTKVIFFVSTFRADPSYNSIENYLIEHGINYEAYDTLKDSDTGKSLITSLVEEMQYSLEQDKLEDTESSDDRFTESRYELYCNETSMCVKKKTMTPKFLIIFDDISEELRHDDKFIALLKKNRHYKSMIVTSSQWFSDIIRGGRNNIDVFILFRGIPEDILKEIYHSIALPLTIDSFKSMYCMATRDVYNFFYIDTDKGEYRKNFNAKFTILSNNDD